MGTLSKKEIYIDDTLENSMQEIVSKIKDLKAKKGLKMIILMNYVCGNLQFYRNQSSINSDFLYQLNN